MQTLVLLFTSMFLNKIFMLLFPGYQLLTSVDLPFMEDGVFPFMPLSLSPFPSSQYCYMKSPSEINSQCHIIWWCKNCSLHNQVGTLITCPFLHTFTHFPLLCLELIALTFKKFVLFSLYISLVPLPPFSIRSVKMFPKCSKILSYYYFFFLMEIDFPDLSILLL